MEKIAVYPGTFDPITNGHIDIIERAAKIFDKIILVIAVNSKKTTMFTEEERLEMAKDSLKHLKNVEVDVFQGLLVNYAKSQNAVSIIRGIRAVSDFDYEFQIALMNSKIGNEISTIFFIPNEKYTYLNSTIIRELSLYNQDVGEFVPQIVSTKLKEKYQNKI